MYSGIRGPGPDRSSSGSPSATAVSGPWKRVRENPCAPTDLAMGLAWGAEMAPVPDHASAYGSVVNEFPQDPDDAVRG